MMRIFTNLSRKLMVLVSISLFIFAAVIFLIPTDEDPQSTPSLLPEHLEIKEDGSLRAATLQSPTPQPLKETTQNLVPTLATALNSTQAPLNDNAVNDTPPTEPVQLHPEDWKKWPIIPSGVSAAMHEIYQQGLLRGNNPHAFSILGDCNSEPEVFLGVFDHDSDLLQQLDSHLLETVEHFKGSFDRYSPTVKKGATEGAMLWAEWNDNMEGYCEANELPIDCELRVHQPIIAFINLGTHYENRHEDYLRIIIQKLFDNGTVPIIVTKADNREKDERVNQTLVNLADEFEIPLWNFWLSVQDLPNKGILDENEMYLNEAALEIHRKYGLHVLDFVFRELEKSNN